MAEEELVFVCPALQDRGPELNLPAPVELSWDICSNGGVSIMFSVIFFVTFFVLVRVANGETVNDILSNPISRFRPPSLRFLVTFIGTLSFVLTAPMFVTRYNTGRWTGKFVMQQLVPDAMAKLVGCEPLMEGNTTYLKYPYGGVPPEGSDQTVDFDYNEWTDWAFLPHASFGILWDFFGTLHIFLATYAWAHEPGPDGSSFHKKLGYFSIFIFFCHMAGASHILYRDVVVRVVNDCHCGNDLNLTIFSLLHTRT